jgi:isopenicillin-N N-acyltransferase like protein
VSAGFPYVRVEGSPFVRGKAHGELCRAAIQTYPLALAAQVRASAETLYGQVVVKSSGSEVTEEVLARRARGYIPLFEEYAPVLLQEIAGVAAGARVPLEHALIANIRGELANANGGGADGCTAFAVGAPLTDDGSVLVGQNCDQQSYNENFGVVLHVVPDDGPEVLMLSFAGLIGYHGVGGGGIAQGATAGSVGAWRMGMPHYPFKRLMLACESLDDCIALARRWPFASGGSYVVGDRSGRVATLEIVPDDDGVRVLWGKGGAAFHTNHWLSVDLVGRDELLSQLPDSPRRYGDMEGCVLTQGGHIAVRSMQGVLARHEGWPASICRHEVDMRTVASFIANVRTGDLYVCRGNPCGGSYERYRLGESRDGEGTEESR